VTHKRAQSAHKRDQVLTKEKKSPRITSGETTTNKRIYYIVEQSAKTSKRTTKSSPQQREQAKRVSEANEARVYLSV
jgi:hypothetical protein